MSTGLGQMIRASGLAQLTVGHVVMWGIAFFLIYLAIRKKYEPLLLVPIAFGMLLVNLPATSLMAPGQGLLWKFYHYGIQWEIIPPLIFLGIGAMTDFGPVIANPKTLLLGAGAQVGIYLTMFGGKLVGLTVRQAAAVSIIGGADGPTTIFVTSILAPELLGAATVAAYSYMALVPIIQPPIMRLLTTPRERGIPMKQLRTVSQVEKTVFPLVAAVVIILMVPTSAPLVGMLMLGNLFRESGVVERLLHVTQNELTNTVTIFLGVAVGASTAAENFLKPQVLMIFAVGLLAFMVCTATGILLAKTMNLFLREKINPLIGAAGVSAVPMSARVVHRFAAEANRKNYLLMHAMGPNVAGVIGTAVAAGLFIALLR
jgi:sodium ion-translocating decarboxylase beta subunit